MAEGEIRAPGLSWLALVALPVALNACSAGMTSVGAATTSPPVKTASAIAGTPEAGSFGLPASIDGWRLVATVKVMYPETAAIVAAAGGDPATAVDVDVEVYGTARLNFDVLRVPGVTFGAFMRAAEPYLIAVGLTERSVLDMAGQTVMRYATPTDASGRFHAVFYTQRGDLLYATGYMTDAQFAALLAGLP